MDRINRDISRKLSLVYLWILLTSISSCHSFLNLFTNSKRNEVISLNTNLNIFDDQLCLNNYETSEGSIIRTKDSLALGASYLNVSELGPKSKDECLRLCCRTPRCNVITFEEKKAGSCYMFDCGSLDNFLCKFTEQNSFMSAILRRKEAPIALPTIPTQSNNMHEEELSQLRKPEQMSPGGLPIPIQNIMPKLQSYESPPNITSSKSIGESSSTITDTRRCSRNQFECKSTGECIAIYNACDGIQQCEDGSDEAPELQCPSANLGIGMQVSSKSTGNVKGSSANLSGQTSLQTSVGDTSSMMMSKQPSQSQDFRLNPMQPVQNPNDPQQKHQRLGPVNGIGSNYNGQVEKTNPNYETPSRTNNAVNNIFNHKDGGLMEDTFGNQSPQQKQNPYTLWKNYDYGVGIGDNQQNYGLPIPQYGSLPYGNNQALGLLPNYVPFYSGSNGIQQSQSAYNNNNFKPQYQPQPYSNNNNNVPVGIDQNGRKTSGVEDQLKSIPTTTSKPPLLIIPEITTAKLKINNSLVKPHSEILKSGITKQDDLILQNLLNKASFQIDKPTAGLNDFEDMDGPGAGAYFSFIIGLSMSVIMVIIVTCRLRKIKMGARRRGKNRLDPDYLVDGMYL